MEIEDIKKSLVAIKIRKDDSYNFTLKEIEAFAKIYDMSIEDFCIQILKINAAQMYRLKSGKFDYVKCIEYKKTKQEFFEKQGSEYRLQIIKEKIKKDYSNRFSLEELKNISARLGVNFHDLCINVLGISRNVTNCFLNGEFKTISSKIYKDDKEEYFSRIKDEILEVILYSKKENDFSSNFSYDEIMTYVNKSGINIRDFLSKILGLNSYGQGQSKMEVISQTDRYFSREYRNFKHEKMQTIGDEILDSFIIERMRKTGTHIFQKDEIETLSKLYNINIRDFIVYVLGKKEGSYYDLRGDRIQKCFSQRYKAKKEELIISKREKFMSEINPNIRTYYSLDELENISSALGISTYDLVVNVMKKSRGNFYRISHNYKNGRKISVGENKSGPLSRNYCESNVNEILTILRIAIRSAIGYMQLNGYKCARYYQDLLQEGYIYLVSNGNPVDENGTLTIQENEYQERHGAILYKKAYFNAINNIKVLCQRENLGEAYDVSIKTKGTSDEFFEDENSDFLIKRLSEDDKDRKILKYFSENIFCDETIEEACKKFKVDSKYIQDLFAKLREKISSKEISLDD